MQIPEKKSRNVSETEIEAYKLLLAASPYYAQFDSILYMLPELFREYRTGCAGVVQSGRNFPKLRRLQLCRECRADCAGHV